MIYAGLYLLIINVSNKLRINGLIIIPIDIKEVRMYSCGPTVYKDATIGNMRTNIFQDVLRRVLKYNGYKLKHVMNITDVRHLTGDGDDGEDKMKKSAAERHQSVLEVAQFYTEAFMKDIDALNIRHPDVICKATEHIPEMIELIKKIEANGHTYMAGGNLYFDISTFPDYGKLANLNLDELKAGAGKRKVVVVDENKRNPGDFVLWFTKSKFEDQAMTWDSPWGRGYPGWHIECSAISLKYLGEYLDIHCGGVDNIFPHHTNEIAQSEAFLNHKWCNYWIHGEHLNNETGKMSKSNGEFLTVSLLTEKGYSPLDYRFMCLNTSYRKVLVFTYDALNQAKNTFTKLKSKIKSIKANLDGNIDELKVEYFNNKFIEAINAPDWQHLQKVMNQGEAAVEYVLSDSTSLGALVLLPQGSPVYVPLTSTNELWIAMDGVADMDGHQKADAMYVQDQLHLYDKLWKPIETICQGGLFLAYRIP